MKKIKKTYDQEVIKFCTLGVWCRSIDQTQIKVKILNLLEGEDMDEKLQGNMIWHNILNICVHDRVC